MITPAELTYARFTEHAKSCGICSAAQPDPERCQPELLCGHGQLLRRTWETTEMVAATQHAQPA